MTLPEPACHHGYPRDQVNEILVFGPRQQAFWDWMYGQTMSICNAEPEYDWVQDTDSPGGIRLVEVGPPRCTEAHGVVVYPWDLANFLQGGAPLD